MEQRFTNVHIKVTQAILLRLCAAILTRSLFLLTAIFIVMQVPFFLYLFLKNVS